MSAQEKQNEPLPALGAVQGSLPVLDAEGLAKLWEDEAAALRMNNARSGYHNHTTISRVYATAAQLEKCAKELRLVMAHTNQRQPEENQPVQRTRALDPSTQDGRRIGFSVTTGSAASPLRDEKE